MSENQTSQEPIKEKPKGNFPKIPLGFVILVVSVLVCATGLLWFASARGAKNKEVQAIPQKRQVYKTSYFQEAIKRKAELAQDSSNTSSELKQSTGSRKFTNQIEVYVYQPDKNKEEKNLQKEKENKKIGLPPGTKIPAITQGTIFSFNTAAPVTCLLTRDIEKDGEILIPKNSKFLGEAGVLKSLNRINVTFNLLIFPDGREIKVRALALSEDGSSGIKGRVDKHTDKRVFKAIGETLLAGASLFTGGISQNAYSIQDQIKMNVAEGFTREASKDLNNEKIDTSITVESFTPIQVILLEGI